VGTWGRHRGSRFATQDAGLTEFQEFQTHFYVSPAEVAMTNSAAWDPDTRATLIPYENADIGTPDWGIRHSNNPENDNASIDATYRDINGGCSPGFVLAARLMGAQRLWNHDAYFDYADRYMALTGGIGGVNNLPVFARNMWQAYAASVDVVSYNDFLLTHFTPLEIADPLLVGRNQDPDGDGRSNKIEHYFGSHPRVPDAAPRLDTGKAQSAFTIRHRTRVRPPNGPVLWQRSNNLMDWFPVEPQRTDLISEEGGMFEVEAEFPLSGESREFFQIQVTD